MSIKLEDRIIKSNAYYAKFSERATERTENRDYDRAFSEFLENLPKRGLILDVGSGAGIHLKKFKEMGFSAVGVEPSDQMRKLASDLGVHSVEGTFENIDRLEFKEVSGIWAAASLLHVPKEELEPTLNKIAELLEPRGVFYFTVRMGTGSKWDKWDDGEGDVERFIQLFSEEELFAALKASSFRVRSSWVEDSYWGRPARWISVVAQKCDQAGTDS